MQSNGWDWKQFNGRGIAFDQMGGSRRCGCLAAGRPLTTTKPTQEGFYQHFKAIAEAVGIPHCVYNIPGRSAKNIEPETIARMAELPNIAMVKEATGSMDQCSQVLNLTNLTVLSGDDSMTLPMMSIGASGVISVAGNIVPKDIIARFKQLRMEITKPLANGTTNSSRSAATCSRWQPIQSRQSRHAVVGSRHG